LKKILIVSALFPPEPVVSASLSYDIASELSERNEVTVLCPIPSRPNGMKFTENVNLNYPFVLRRVKSYISNKSTIYSRFRESHSFGLQTAKFINLNHKNIDLIYMNTWPLLAQLYTVYIAKKNSIPVVTHIQDIYPESLTQKLPLVGKVLNKMLLPIDKFIAKNSRSLITISHGMKELLVKSRSLPSDKVLVAFNWQDENKFAVNAEQLPEKEELFTFMFLGSVNILANIESVILAFKNANLKGCRLVIAGEGPEKNNLMNLVEKNNIDNVLFLSFNSKDVGIVQSTSDVLVLSLKQGASSLAFPSKIPAYMFSSRPILAYVDIPSDIANTIKDANCGWVVQSGNMNELLDCMTKIVSIEKTALRNMGQGGKEYAHEHLSRSANLKRIVSIIEKHLN
jgi:glycosyltransferase involved in cell wall biosynthesis